MGIKDNQEQAQDEQIDLAALAQQGGDIENQGGQEEQQQEETVDLTATEQTAFDQGWRPQDDFEGDQDNWKTAKEYIKDGEWIAKLNATNKKLDDQQRQFDERLSNANKLNEVRRKSEIESLRIDQSNAVNDADREGYDAAQVKIDAINKQSQDEVDTTTSQSKDPDVAEWETKNPWINDTGNIKTAVTQGIWNSFLQQNPAANSKQALAHVDTELEKLYPSNNSNARRSQPNSTESQQRRSRRSSKDLSMSDLTNEEQQQWNQFGKSIFKTEKAFLKAVTDTRGS